MNILIFNCGSSSLSFKVYQLPGDGSYSSIAFGKAKKVATKTQAGSAIETSGSDMTAMKDGESLDISMECSSLPGLMMATRCGDIDAEIVLEMGGQGNSPDEVSKILNHLSGVIGLSGFSSNLAEVIEEAGKGNSDC
jgi:acetate kinase